MARFTIKIFVVLFLKSLLLHITVQMEIFNNKDVMMKIIKQIASKISTDCKEVGLDVRLLERFAENIVRSISFNFNLNCFSHSSRAISPSGCPVPAVKYLNFRIWKWQSFVLNSFKFQSTQVLRNCSLRLSWIDQLTSFTKHIANGPFPLREWFEKQNLKNSPKIALKNPYKMKRVRSILKVIS